MDPDAIGTAGAMEAMQMMGVMDAPPGGTPDAPQTWDKTKMDPDVIGVTAAMEAMQMMGGMDAMMAPGGPLGDVGAQTGPDAKPDIPVPPAAAPAEEDKPATAAKVEVSEKPDDDDEEPDRASPSTIEGMTNALGAGSKPQDKLVRSLGFFSVHHFNSGSLSQIALAIAQAAKLFDKKNGGKPIDPETRQMKVQCMCCDAQKM